MILGILLVLVVADLILVAGFLRLHKNQNVNSSIIREITDERAMLSELRAQIRSELTSAQQQIRTIKEQVQVLATEAEQEVRDGVNSIQREVDQILAGVGERLEAPLQALTEKQHFVAKMLKDLSKERESLARITNRAESLSKILNASTNWNDLFQEMESKRMNDMRAMISSGAAHEKIAQEFGVSIQQVKMVANTI